MRLDQHSLNDGGFELDWPVRVFKIKKACLSSLSARHKILHRTVFLLVSLVQAFSPLGLTAQAAPNDTATWQKLKEADGRVEQLRVEWKRTHIVQPSPTLDVEKLVAKNAERNRAESSASITEQLRQIDRVFLTREKNGWQQTSAMLFLREKSLTLCKIYDSDTVNLESVAARLQELPTAINYLDSQAQISAELSLALSVAPKPGQFLTKELLSAGRWSGRITRNDSLPVPLVGIENLPFLVGLPFFQDYTSTNSSLKEASAGHIVLERQTSLAGSQTPMLKRWTISRQNWRPVLFEYFYNLPRNKSLVRRIRFDKYQRYPGDIWFPSLVSNEHGALEVTNTKPSFTDEYKLVSVKFNQEADTSELLRPFPKGSNISDARFAPRPAVNYTIEKGVPADDFVLKLVKQREAENSNGLNPEKAHAAENHEIAHAKRLSVPIGAILMSFGLMLWVRDIRRKNPR